MKLLSTKAKESSILRISLFTLSLFMFTHTFSQTGPGGVGNTSNNHIWLDASSLGLPNGSVLANWADQSGNGNDFNQIPSPRQPLFDAVGFNGLPAVKFDGIDDVVFSSSIPALETPNITHFIVYRLDSLGSGVLINSSYDGNEEKWITYTNRGISRMVNAHKYSTFTIHASYNYTLAEPSFLSSHITPTSIRTYEKGNLKATTAGTYSTPTGHNFVLLGRKYKVGANAYRLKGLIAEAIVYNTTLNNLERILVENYLGAKYHLTIVNDLYDYEVDHRYGVIGIGNNGTNSQTSAIGSGIVEISEPTDLGSDEYELIGHSGEKLEDLDRLDLPPSLVLSAHARFKRTWRVDETGSTGDTKISFHLAENNFAETTSYRLLVDTDGTFTDATIVTGTFDAATKIMSFDVDLDNGDYFTLAGVQQILSIHSIVDGNWSETTTWDCDCIPSSNDSVFIDPATNVTVNENAFVEYLKVENAATLTMNADFTLDIDANFDIAGTLVCTDGGFSFSGLGEQEISLIAPATSVSFYNLTAFNESLDSIRFKTGEFILEGTFYPNRGNIVLNPGADFIVNSTSATTGGRIGVIYAPTSFTGDYTVKRFLPPGNADWRNLCSPVLGATLEQWDPDLAMSGPGFPDGCAYDADGVCFKSVIYQERSIPYPVSNVTREITNNFGFEVFVGDDLETFSGTTLQVKGPLNSATDIVKPMNTGWWIIGNPYASPIAFSEVNTGPSITPYYYVYDSNTGGYQYYHKIDGPTVPEITGDGLIASGQAVWVYCGSSANLVFEQSDKATNDATFIRSDDDVNTALGLQLSENISTYSCTVFLEEQAYASDLIDEMEDIRHFKTGREKAPTFAIVSDSIQIRKNFIKQDGFDKIFNLVAEPKNEGYYTIKAENWANFRDYNKIILVDINSGTSTDLKESDYTFYSSMSEDDEQPKPVNFKLVLTNSLGTDTPTSPATTNVTETKVNDVLAITQMGHIIEAVSTESYETPTTVSLVNTIGQEEVFTTSLDLMYGSNLINLPSRFKGFYILTLRTGNDVVTKKIVL